MPKPLRLGLSGSSFIYAMPREILEIAYGARIEGRPLKFDDRQNRMMVEFMRDLMRVQSEMEIEAMECYHATSWDGDMICEVVEGVENVEFWSVHAPYGRYIDPSAPDDEAREGALREYKDAVATAARLGAKVVVSHPGANVEYGIPKSERLKIAAQTIAEVANFASERGVSLAVEPLPKQEPGNSLEEVLEIIEMAGRPNVGINFDVNHLFPAAAIPGLIRKAGDKILSVHISDQDDQERHWLPFLGKLDWTEVLAALVDVGYSGPLVYETHIKDAVTCEEVGRRVVENYKQLIQLKPNE